MFNSELGQPHHGLVVRDAIQPEVPCDCQHPPRWTSSRKTKHPSPLLPPSKSTIRLVFKCRWYILFMIYWDLNLIKLFAVTFTNMALLLQRVEAEAQMQKHAWLHMCCALHTCIYSQATKAILPPPHGLLTLIYRSCYVRALRSEVDILIKSSTKALNISSEWEVLFSLRQSQDKYIQF